MRPPLAGSYALTHGPCTDSFISLRAQIPRGQGRAWIWGLDRDQAGVGQSLEPEAVLSYRQDLQPPVPAPFEPLDVSLQLFGQGVVPADL